MRYTEREHKVFGKPNLLDQSIVHRAGNPTEQEIYQARWVWYHTILAVEIFLTNVLLVALLVVEIVK